MAWMQRLCGAWILAAFAAAAPAQTPPSYDFDFATIGAAGNAAYSGPDPWGLTMGRGAVGYEYRIARHEVTTSQWMEFLNTFAAQPQLFAPGGPRLLWGPSTGWGAQPDPTYSGPGRRYRLIPGLANAGLVPVHGVSWRDAALLCNWLHHDKSASWATIQNGAYDASTFVNQPGGTWSDQRTHHPDAKFWIPTLDEWIKAAHYDPNRYGPGQAGWWQYSNGSDSPPVPGLPGEGETSATLSLPGFAEYSIPLGAYPETQSPWELLDTSGGEQEWTEEIYSERWRMLRGSSVGWASSLDLDRVYGVDTAQPFLEVGTLRIASQVPAPGSAILIVLTCVIRRKR